MSGYELEMDDEGYVNLDELHKKANKKRGIDLGNDRKEEEE